MSKRLFGRRGPVCPHCGGVERISKMQGKSTRVGLYKCYQCRKPFTVRMKTIFEFHTFNCISGCKRSICFARQRKYFEQPTSSHPWQYT